MSDEPWVKIFTTEYAHQAEIAVQILEDENILAVVFNKRDSSYNTFGDIEVLVKQSQVLRAKQIIKNLEQK